MIRIEKAPTDPRGKSISITDVDEQQRIDLGMLRLPPKYYLGEYNNQYIDETKEERIIFSQKILRKDPLVTESLVVLRKIFENDKKFKKKIKKNLKKKSVNLLSTEEFVDNLFDAVNRPTKELINMNYFSQYIHELGFRFSVDLVLN